MDSLQAFVNVDGRLEKVDTFCGINLPKPIMSNGPKLMLEFRGTQSSRYSKGFKISYSFVESKYFFQLDRTFFILFYVLSFKATISPGVKW